MAARRLVRPWPMARRWKGGEARAGGEGVGGAARGGGLVGPCRWGARRDAVRRRGGAAR